MLCFVCLQVEQLEYFGLSVKNHNLFITQHFYLSIWSNGVILLEKDVTFVVNMHQHKFECCYFVSCNEVSIAVGAGCIEYGCVGCDPFELDSASLPHVFLSCNRYVISDHYYAIEY